MTYSRHGVVFLVSLVRFGGVFVSAPCHRLLVSSEDPDAEMLSGRLFERVLRPAERAEEERADAFIFEEDMDVDVPEDDPIYISTTGWPLVFLELR